MRILEFLRALFHRTHKKKPAQEISSLPPPQPLEPSEPKPIPKKETQELPEGTVRSELNLEKNAVFAVANYTKRSRQIKTQDGRTITIGVTGSGMEVGILTTNHFKIYLTLVELWEKAGRPTQEYVHFTTYRLIKRLGLKDSGGEVYHRLKRWLRDLKDIPITFSHSFYMPQADKYEDLLVTNILSHLHILEQKKDKKIRGYGEFKFAPYILENLLNYYVHPLRLDVINSFGRNSIAILLYTFIDRNLAFKNQYEINLENLFENLDLSQRYIKYPSGRKKIIEPILKDLEGKPLSTGILTHCSIKTTKDGKNYKLVCRKRPFKTALKGPESPTDKRMSQKQEEQFTQPEANEALKSQIKAFKEGLSSEERAELRKRALEKIKNMPGIKEEFVGEPLIESVENELIREKV